MRCQRLRLQPIPHGKSGLLWQRQDRGYEQEVHVSTPRLIPEYYPESLTLRSVVTQFQEKKVTQFFVQNGKKIEIPAPTYEGISDSSAITPEFCTNQFKVFDDRDRFSEVGGFPQLAKAFQVPMVLVMSIWDDVSTFVLGYIAYT